MHLTSDLSASARRALRAAAHHLDPVVTIGQAGLTPSVLHEVDIALAAHALIKVRAVSDDRALRESWMRQICSALQCEPVQHLGKLFVLWRNRQGEMPVDEPVEAAAEARAPRRGPRGRLPEPQSERASTRRGRSGFKDDMPRSTAPHGFDSSKARRNRSGTRTALLPAKERGAEGMRQGWAPRGRRGAPADTDARPPTTASRWGERRPHPQTVAPAADDVSSRRPPPAARDGRPAMSRQRRDWPAKPATEGRAPYARRRQRVEDATGRAATGNQPRAAAPRSRRRLP